MLGPSPAARSADVAADIWPGRGAGPLVGGIQTLALGAPDVADSIGCGEGIGGALLEASVALPLSTRSRPSITSTRVYRATVTAARGRGGALGVEGGSSACARMAMSASNWASSSCSALSISGSTSRCAMALDETAQSVGGKVGTRSERSRGYCWRISAARSSDHSVWAEGRPRKVLSSRLLDIGAVVSSL